MENLNSLNCCHLVLAPSKLDLNRFEEHLPSVINWISTKKTISFYSISIEHEDTNRHADIILFSKSEFKNVLTKKGKQLNFTGQEEIFVHDIMKNTSWNIYWSGIKNKTTDHEKKYYMGYNLKERPERNWNNFHLTDEFKEELIQYQIEHDHTKKEYEIDLTVLNPKNATYELLKLIEENEKINISNLLIESIKLKYCWIGISKNQVKKLFHQLKIMLNIEEEYDVQQLQLDIHGIKSDAQQGLEHYESFKEMPSFERLKMLKEHGFIKDEEYETLRMSGFV